MREKFICAHFVTSWHCKIGSKAHFFAATPPHLFRPKISVFPTFPRFEPDSGRFFKRSRSFFALRSPLFSRLSSFWSQLRTIFREIFPTFPSALPFLHSVKAFSFRVSLSLPFSSPSFSIDFLSALHSPLPLHSLSHFLSHSSPLFHLPPQLPHERAHPRALRAHAYTRTYPHVRRFSFIAFTASHPHHNSLCTNALGVKENEKKPSPKTQPPHNQYINTKHPISSAVNFISSPR